MQSPPLADFARPHRPTVSFVIVSYNSGDLVERCVDSIGTALAAQPDAAEREIVVIETGQDETARFAGRQLTYQAVRNLGYGYACNAGAARATADVLVFLNADTEVLRFPVADVLGLFGADPSLALVAPTVFENGAVINTLRPRPSVWRDFLGELHLMYPRSRHNGHHGEFQGWAGGMALVVRSAAFRAIVGFDEGFFLYYEDADLGARVCKHGFKQVYSPMVAITHLSGGSSQELGTRKTLLRYESKLRYMTRHLDRGGFAAHLLLTIPMLVIKALAGVLRPSPRGAAHFRALRIYWSSGVALLRGRRGDACVRICEHPGAPNASREHLSPTAPIPVSVVVVARDEATRIAACLDSIRAARPNEIIVIVDDRTVDDTAALAVPRADRVIIAKGYRGGLRNVGWRAAGGEWVCFVDADHILPPDYIQVLWKIITSDWRLAMVGAPLLPSGPSMWERMASMIWDFRGAFGAGGSLYRRAAVEAVGGFRDELHCGEDGDLSARLVEAGWGRRLCRATSSWHIFPRTFAETAHKLKYAAAGGITARSLARILLSFPAAIVMSVRYRSGHILWYCPWRAIYLAFFGGLPPGDYHPQSRPAEVAPATGRTQRSSPEVLAPSRAPNDR